MPVGFHGGTTAKLISQLNKARTICSISSSVQLKTLPDLNFFFVLSSSVDASDLRLATGIGHVCLYGLPGEHFILLRLLDFRAFYLCTQSSEEGTLNRIVSY